MSLALTPRQEAQQAQGRASDPVASAWVGASAGSGKTKVLTDRVLRLLLAPGTRPGAILCLTFTKAAAAEMANRLARELGRWAVLPESELAAKLATLLERAPARRDLDRARELFAEVLDLPGGMRISTIHAFCQSLLRAFPLEAGLAPQFSVVEDADAAALLAEAREAVLAAPAGQQAALEALAGLVPPDRFAELLKRLVRDRERLAAALRETHSLPGLLAAIAAHLGLDADAHEGALVAQAAGATEPDLVTAARLLEASRNANDQARGRAILDWVALGPAQRTASWGAWVTIFLTKEATPRARLATRDVGPRQGECAAILAAEAARVAAVEGSRRAVRLLAATRALLGLGAPVLEGYRQRKAAAGLMDYDDLILAAQRVLQDPGSAWVLFKLDNGLDHLLLDEAQDSNRAQWGIAAALTEEFFATAGGGDRARTIFAVGDTKQSIYGFQGADPGGFSRWKRAFAQRAALAQAELRDVQLQVSFRSTAPVLALVDAVFAQGAAREGVVAPGEMLTHRADRVGQAGVVELWPMLDGAEAAAPPAWEVPEAPESATGPDALLAEALAAQIHHWLASGEALPARGRTMRAGDILVLVRKRAGALLPRLVRALKRLGVPVGGADRMVLVEQLAVQDLLALGDAALLPEDDLQLAAALTSPLIGLTQEQLLALAAPRKGSLWAALAAERGRDTPEGRAADFLAHLMARADLVTPHALFAEVLGEHGGLHKLLARLGPDAADPVAEFLNAALDHGARHPPSLQGFLHWLRRGGAEVKREQEAAADAVRIMTVHGAKGLQAPVVILPDTAGPGRDQGDVRWHMPEQGPPLPLWAPNKDHHAPAFATLLAAEKQARAEEEHRLLYVALTRAEDRLLVCGWQKKPPKDRPWKEGTWYDLVAQGFAAGETLPFAPEAFGAPAEARFKATTLRRIEAPQTAPPLAEQSEAAAASTAALPDWARRPAPPEAVPDALAPSLIPLGVPAETETPAAAPHGATDPTGRRFRRGRLVHALLQHLPERSPAEREAAARAYLARPGHGLDAAEQAETLAEVLALLAAPAIAAAFGPGSLAEAPVAGRVGDRLVSGQVDRLLVTPGRVLVLDYKTNRPPPAGVEGVPVPYLRQMAAYRAVLRQAFPGHAVVCALVWTYGARLMPLSEELLDSHAPGAW
jgi:ATP-dependent helicase/nuclease subunit A